MNFDDPQVQEMVFVPVWELGQSNMEHDGGRSETGVAVLVYYESGRWWGIEEDGMVRSWHPESPPVCSEETINFCPLPPRGLCAVCDLPRVVDLDYLCLECRAT
jgi:hypothetical protein